MTRSRRGMKALVPDFEKFDFVLTLLMLWGMTFPG
jgi:hypothetical protein